MRATIFAIIAVLALLFVVYQVSAQATGAGLTNISTSKKNASDPDWGNHSKGAIHTIKLDGIQQNNKWKAYVGNVTSTFVLDDSDDYTIYQWSIDSFTGQVYISRNDSVNWGTVDCANVTHKESEDTSIEHSSSSADSVNITFNQKGHKSFDVGSNGINQDECFSISTWVNDTSQDPPSSTDLFQEVLLWDTTTSSMVYTTMVENDLPGYRNDPAVQNETFDFQAIVPEHNNATYTSFTYYFYLELTSN
jgi:hypothetical protein